MLPIWMENLQAFGFPFLRFDPLGGAGHGWPAIAAAVVFYFLPSMVAAHLRSTRYLSILTLNLLLGWSILGWFGTLLWALYGRTEADLYAVWRERDLQRAAERGDAMAPPESVRLRHAASAMWVSYGLLGAAMVAAMVAVTMILDQSNGHGAGGEWQTANATATSTSAPPPNVLDLRVTLGEIINACGQPERQWTTTIGEGVQQQNVQHLWYSKAPAEIRLAARPNDKDASAHNWVFAGASATPGSEASYSGVQLKQQMPCMTRWADAYTAATKDRQGTVN